MRGLFDPFISAESLIKNGGKIDFVCLSRATARRGAVFGCKLSQEKMQAFFYSGCVFVHWSPYMCVSCRLPKRG